MLIHAHTHVYAHILIHTVPTTHTQVGWEEGLKKTFDWYKQNSSRFGDIETALSAHPRAGLDKGSN